MSPRTWMFWRTRRRRWQSMALMLLALLMLWIHQQQGVFVWIGSSSSASDSFLWESLQSFKRQQDSTTNASRSADSPTKAQIANYQATITSASSHGTSSLVHCVGDNFLSSAWIYRSCQYRNVCRTKKGEWTLRPSLVHQTLKQIWRLQHGNSSFARYSTNFDNHTVSLNPATAASIRKQKWQWSPRVVDNDDEPVIRAEDVIGVFMYYPQLPTTNTHMFEVLYEVLLPMYNLLGLFGWQNEHGKVHVYLLEDDDEPKNTNTTQWLKRALRDFLGYTLVVVEPPSEICIARAVAGMGVLSASGVSKRGQDVKDYTTHKASHNAGRGATLWEFRQAILLHRQRQGETSAAMERMQRVRAVLAIPTLGTAGDSHQRLLARLLRDAFPKNQTSVDFSLVTLDDIITSNRIDDGISLISQAQQSNIWIALAHEDEWTWPALFLPRKSTLILLYNSTQFPKRPPVRRGRTAQGNDSEQQQHPVYSNFGLWNHMTHLQVQWLALPTNESETEWLVAILTHLIRGQQLRRGGHAISDAVGDWTLNGQVPVQLVRRSPLPSNLHCVGENWQWDAVNHRSCHFENLCWNLETKEYMWRPESKELSTLLESSSRSNQQHRSSLSNLAAKDHHDKHVMMGQTIRRGTGDPWFPVEMGNHTKAYYTLPYPIAWLPYFAEVPNANNPGHLLWDYFLPLYTLMELFFGPMDPNEQGSPRMLLTHLDNDCVPAGAQSGRDGICHKLTTKFLPLLGVDPASFSSARDARLDLKDHFGNPMQPETPVVCASHALAGIGMLTDHGVKKHGQLLEDYQTVHNAGRGIAFWRFRNHMVRNMELMSKPAPQRTTTTHHQPPFVITFSINSSNNPSRRRDFDAQIKLLQTHYPTTLMKVQAIQLGALSLQEQLQVMHESSVFISVIGGSASTAMFLERNSCLILYYNDMDDFVKDQSNNNKRTRMPAMLDWDFWNHASYLRVHWLPLSTMDRDLELFGRLMETELEFVGHVGSHD